MSLRELAAPVVEPVTVAQARNQLRITDNNSDVELERYIAAARRISEHYTRRAWVQRQYVQTFDGFASVIKLGVAPLLSVQSIDYVDTDGNTQTVTNGSPETFIVDTAAEPGEIRLSYNATWPAYRVQRDAVTITFTAGYPGDGASPQDWRVNVPDEAVQAILLLVGAMDRYREAFGPEKAETMPLGWQSWLHPLRVFEL